MLGNGVKDNPPSPIYAGIFFSFSLSLSFLKYCHCVSDSDIFKEAMLLAGRNGDLISS